MEDYNKDIDDLFRAGLGSYTETPPARVWPALEKRLENRRKRPAIGWFWPLTLLSFSILIAGVIAWKGNFISEQVNSTPHILPAENTRINANSSKSTPTTPPISASTSNQNNSSNQDALKNKKTFLTQPITYSNTSKLKIVNSKIAQTHNNSLVNAKNTPSALISSPKTATLLPVKSLAANMPSVETEASIQPLAKVQAKAATEDFALPRNNIIAADISLPTQQKPFVDLQKDAPAHKPKEDTTWPKELKIRKPIILGTGIAAGYETGMQANAANKALVAPYVSVPLTRKLSLKLQPALGISNVANHALGGTNSYYQRVSNSTTVNLHQEAVVNAFNPNDTLGFMVNYNYSQSHDSLAKSYTSGGTFFEAQLPVLIQYSLTDKLSVYGGLNLVYSKYVPVAEHTYNSGPQTTTGSSPVVFVPKGETMPQAPPVDSVIILKGTPISQYNGPAYTANSGNRLSVGYMLGVSYKLNNSWSADLLIQQSGVSANTQAGIDVNAPLTTPYIRIMIGYKFKDLIIKPKH